MKSLSEIAQRNSAKLSDEDDDAVEVASCQVRKSVLALFPSVDQAEVSEVCKVSDLRSSWQQKISRFPKVDLGSVREVHIGLRGPKGCFADRACSASPRPNLA